MVILGATHYHFTVFWKEECYSYIRMGLTIFKICISGGITLEIGSEITFYGYVDALK